MQAMAGVTGSLKIGIGRVVDGLDAARRNADQRLHIAPGGVGNGDHALPRWQAPPEPAPPDVIADAVAVAIQQTADVVNGHDVGIGHARTGPRSAECDNRSAESRLTKQESGR